ncbi:MAG: sulfatase-like hydrolase/transferase [Planctomycetota bacterium]
MSRFSQSIAMLIAACAGALALAAPTRAAAPSIVVVFIDDMGWSDLSCFGGPPGATPNIDRLADEGLRFTQFYVNSPICSPSRVALSTGQYPQRWRITSYLARRELNAERGLANWLDPSAPMVARNLQAKGYATGHFGKWHMGGQRDVGEAPLITEYGFDASLTNFEGLGPRVLALCHEPGKKNPKRWTLGSDKLGRGEITWVDRSRVTEAFTGAALDFAKQAHADGKPFFINVWPDDVHTPLYPPLDRWAEPTRAKYEAVLTTMDEQLAPLFDWLRDDEELRQNTLVVFCSDNGPQPSVGSSDPLRGGKAMLFEGGVRSPLIVWGPGLLANGVAGTRNESSVLSSIDLAVSVVSVAGAKSLADADGEDLSATLLGREQASRSKPLFFSRPPDRKEFVGVKNLPDLAVREGPWKLLCDFDGSRQQLYDLSADAAESNNLAESNREVADALTQKVLSWHTLAQPAAP